MWGTLGDWVGSPDLEKALLFGFWCSNSHAQNVQANGRFCLLARGSIFLKARCARLEAWHLLPPRRRNTCRQRCTSKQLLTARCAARAFLFAVCAAAVLRAHQLCSWSTSRSKSKERGAWSIGKKSAAALRCSASCNPLCGILPFPPFFSKGNGHFHPSPRKIFACGAHY